MQVTTQFSKSKFSRHKSWWEKLWKGLHLPLTTWLLCRDNNRKLLSEKTWEQQYTSSHQLYNISSSFMPDEKKEKFLIRLMTAKSLSENCHQKWTKTGVRLHDNNIAKYCSRITSPLKLRNNRNFNIIQELSWLRWRKLFELDSEFDE